MVFPHIPYVLPAKNHIGTDPPTDGPGLRGTRRRPTGNPVPEFRLFRNRNPTVAFRAARRYSRRMRTVTLDFSHMVRRDPPEVVLLQIVPGQKASFKVDALGGARFTGHVENLAPAAGSEFAVLKPDNATGNFVKVAQRLAVRIRIDPGQEMIQRLRPGMSVEARIDTAD